MITWLLGSQRPWQCRLCRSTGGYCHRRYGGIRAFSSSAAPVRIEHEGGAPASVVGILAAPNVQGYRLPQLQVIWPYQRLFLTSDSWILEGLFG